MCCWLAWSRFRVVLPSWDQSLGSLTGGLDRALRVIGGAPAYLLTDMMQSVVQGTPAAQAVATTHDRMVQIFEQQGLKQ